MSASAAASLAVFRGSFCPPKMARVSYATATTAPSVYGSRGAIASSAHDRFRGGAAGRRRRSRAVASLDDASPSSSTSEPLEDLTRPGLTPWQVLGLANADDCTVAEVKAAYRARMKRYHPDVYQGEGDGEAMARRIVAAYSAVVEDNASSDALVDEWDGVSEVFPWAKEDADPFQYPEGPADAVFVNAFNCRGRGACPSYCCCVERCAGSFSWVEDTNAAKFDGPTWTELTRRQQSQNVDTTKTAAAEAYALNLAVGQCPALAIHWVTPRQRRRLDDIVAAAVKGFIDPSDAAVEVYELLAKASFENRRAAAPPSSKRTPRSSTEWVDWY